jgi:hypothetical protein
MEVCQVTLAGNASGIDGLAMESPFERPVRPDAAPYPLSEEIKPGRIAGRPISRRAYRYQRQRFVSR